MVLVRRGDPRSLDRGPLRPSLGVLTPEPRGAVAAAKGSAGPSTERNEWGRDARSEVPAQPLEVALRSLELSSRRQDSVESLSESELGLI